MDEQEDGRRAGRRDRAQQGLLQAREVRRRAVGALALLRAVVRRAAGTLVRAEAEHDDGGVGAGGRRGRGVEAARVRARDVGAAGRVDDLEAVARAAPLQRREHALVGHDQVLAVVAP